MAGPETPFPLRSKDEPGVPFPLLPVDDEDYGPAADKYGFCRDCPFPSRTQRHTLDVPGGKLHRELGRATYKASEIAGVVTITAAGTSPNLNTMVTLVQLPLMIWPPRFALYFTNPEFVLPATHPFNVSASLLTHQRLQAIVVEDADGIHATPVENF